MRSGIPCTISAIPTPREKARRASVANCGRALPFSIRLRCVRSVPALAARLSCVMPSWARRYLSLLPSLHYSRRPFERRFWLDESAGVGGGSVRLLFSTCWRGLWGCCSRTATIFGQGFPLALLRSDEDGQLCVGTAVLSRRCSQAHGDLPEGCQERKRLRQVNHHAAHRDHHPRTQFQEPFPKRPYLRTGTVGQRGL